MRRDMSHKLMRRNCAIMRRIFSREEARGSTDRRPFHGPLVHAQHRSPFSAGMEILFSRRQVRSDSG